MSGPWEKYAKPAAPAAGPWVKYQKTQAQEDAPKAEAVDFDTLGAQLDAAAPKERHMDAPVLNPQGAADWRNDGKTGLREQSMSGVNEGIADIVGFPVDAITGGINGVTGSINWLTGAEIPSIQNPAGGSQSVRNLLAPTISQDAPQTTAQRYGRSIGREAGASVIPVLGQAGRGVRAADAGLQAASVVGSGIGAQAARDVAPGNVFAEVAGSLIGGGVPIAASRAKTPRLTGPSVDDLRAQAQGMYSAGEARPGADPSSVQGLAAQIDSDLQSLNVKTPTGRVVADGNVKKFLDVLDDYQGQSMPPAQMQTMRRILQDAASSTDPSDRRIGTALLGRFDEWRGQHVPEYGQADALYGRMKRAEDIDWRVEKAERRASSTGTGGNQVNAARQNIRQILDNPKLRRGYSPEELLEMERIVRGTPAVNALRLAGRLSPTSGSLPLMANIAGTGWNPAVGIPLMIGSYGMKAGAEALTGRQINALGEMIRNGSPLPAQGISDGQANALMALAVRAATGVAN